ncbi:MULTISPECIES: hypothetical protein [unclassified Streptomyces]|nr:MULTISPECIES: hypothetical protein [unclassified Streptomyces]
MLPVAPGSVPFVYLLMQPAEGALGVGPPRALVTATPAAER